MRYFVIIICVIIVATILFVCIESYRENRRIAVSKYTLKSEKIKKNISAVMISDLHNSQYGSENKNLLKRIDELKPDIILIAGDIIIGKEGYSCDIAINLLNKLGEKYNVYVAKGNHELRCSMYTETYGNMWEQLYRGTCDKVKWLINDAVYLDDSNVCVYGLDIDVAYYRRFKKLPMEAAYMKGVLPDIDKNAYNILLAHNPDYFDEYVLWGADLSLSGHVHGGMIIIPKIGGLLSPMVKFFPKYYKGVYTKNMSHMIVSAGLGIHTFRFRVNNIPELVYIDIEKI